MEGLQRLSDLERDVLGLLASGHDAKSASAVLGISTHAVNERLRGARRKLGVGSSREAARLYGEAQRSDAPHQEICNEKIDLPIAAETLPVSGKAQSPAFRSRIVIIMSLIALTATTALLLQSMNAAPTVPSVIATTPAQGATVAAGPTTLSITYDQPMQPRSYSFVRTGEGAYPDCARAVRQSDDGRTFTIQCQLRPGTRYVIWLNHGRFMNFRDRLGQAALPYRLTFTTQP